MKPYKKFPNVYQDKKRLYTKSIIKGEQYREFDPKTSKLAAAIVKGISQIGIKDQNIVLYLGAGSGNTPSFVSDMVGKAGFVFAIDFAPRVVRDLVFVAEKSPNIAPLLADCNHPETYSHLICQADVLYQDIAQRNQVEIFRKNFVFLKRGGFALLAVKARSIDVTEKPKHIFKQVRKELEGFTAIVDYRELEPYERDHALFVCKKK